MNFRTKISLSKQSHGQISYDSNLLLLGSCFAENIGCKLEYFKFQSSVNPFGILFHPIAIEKLILKAINEENFTEEDIFYLNERWHCFNAHSSLSANSKEELLESLNKALNTLNQQLNNSTHIIITLGSAWVYRYIETNSIVTNCHKVPQKKFIKELLSVEDIVESLDSIVSLVKNVNADASIVFTVSPVRHLKDGFVENNRSKSHLLSAVHQVVEPRRVLYYFPSYEIMMDELRDYRFYEEDMIHPNALAIDYIWERFKEVCISEQSFSTMDDVETIQKGLSHKPFNPESEQHQKFLANLEKKRENIQNQFPFISFEVA
ncbi:GSCFA domain-containing protein [Flavobacteriaceae sp. LMIT009]